MRINDTIFLFLILVPHLRVKKIYLSTKYVTRISFFKPFLKSLFEVCNYLHDKMEDIRNLSLMFQKFMLTVNIGCGTRIGNLSFFNFRFYMINMPLQKNYFTYKCPEGLIL